MSNQTMTLLRLIISAAALALVSACGGAGGDNSGVTEADNLAVAAVEPLVGVWDLPGDWNGTSGDEANLLIRSPNDRGVAEAAIYDLDDAIAGAERNCFDIDGGSFGKLTQSLTNANQFFLDLAAFSAIAELQPNGELEISVFTEGAASGTAAERVLTAQRLGITENELTLCVG